MEQRVDQRVSRVSGGAVKPIFLILALFGINASWGQNVASASNPLSVATFGARGDCKTDDTAAFNAYAAALRSQSGYRQYRQFTLESGRCYALAGSVNLTALSNLVFAGNGSTLIGTVPGYPILDVVQSSQVIIKDLYCIAGTGPTTCIQMGRALMPGTVTGIADTNSSGNSLQNVFTAGPFSVAGVYLRASETMTIVNSTLQTQGAGAYGLVVDGDAHFPIRSLFGLTFNPAHSSTVDNMYPYAATTFGDLTIVGGSIQSQNGPCLWMSNPLHHKYLGTYLNCGARGPATIVSFHPGDSVQDLEMDVHSEPVSLTSDILITGSATSAVLTGFRYRQGIDEANNAVFSRGTGVSSVAVYDMHLNISGFLNAPVLFDDPGAWFVSGEFYVPTGSWNATAWAGQLNDGGAIRLQIGNIYSTATDFVNSTVQGELYLRADKGIGMRWDHPNCPVNTFGFMIGDACAASVDAGGNYHSGPSIGVSCSGAPTAAFASVGGVVTHC